MIVDAGPADGIRPIDCFPAHRAAERLGVSHTTVIKMARRGQLDAIKLGRIYYVRDLDIDELIARRAGQESA